VILKGAFDKLMQDIGSNQLMDVSSGEVVCKGLSKKVRLTEAE
jgi:hypothetical protein